MMKTSIPLFTVKEKALFYSQADVGIEEKERRNLEKEEVKEMKMKNSKYPGKNEG